MPLEIKYDDKLFEELRKKLDKAKDQHVKVGVLEANGSTTVGEGAEEITMAELAAIHEFGAPAAGIPERSFLRKTFTDEEGRAGLQKTLIALGKAVVAERTEVPEALDKLGAWAVAQIKKRIKAHIPPPLAEETLKRKLSKHGAGGSTPLVATGQLINSITWEVRG